MKEFYTILAAALLATAAFAQNEPSVTTNKSFARGATMAFGRATFKAVNNNTISERGFCWSKDTKEPTIEDAHSKKNFSNNGLIYIMDDLEPATVYYARPYAIGKDGSVGYGEVLKIVTLPMGTVTWSYDNGADAAANERINSAVASCAEYWNKLTNIEGLFLNVHYGSGTPTADCSYGGWMRVGPNQSYQRTGTIMHEALHAIGVGQHDVWYGSSSPLRAGSGTGQWLGTRATEFVRFWDNNASAIVNGDNTHIWPYGINGANEDNGTDALYCATSLLAQAVGEDGLPCTTARPYGSPYYSFNQEDDIKYYIKNESETYGLMTSYLVEESGKLVWKAMSAAEAIANDAAAWTIKFTPKNQFYQLINVASGKQVSYGDAQLMPSRKEVTSSTGVSVTSAHSYWFVFPSQNGALSAGTNGTTSIAAFDLSDNATRQRWAILTEPQATQMENVSLLAYRDLFAKTRANVEALLQTPHIQLVEDADQTFISTIDQLSAKCEAATDASEIETCNNDLLTAAKTFLSSVCVSDLEQPFSLTFLLKNPDFATDKSGWSGTIINDGVWNYQCVEFYQKSANTTQTLADMPKGTYQLSMQGFQRPGSYTNVYNDFIAGTNNVGGKLYLEKSSAGVLVKNIMEDRSTTSLDGGDKKMTDGTYIPDNMASASAHFKKGYYDNTVQYYYAGGNLKLGYIASGNTGSSYWTIFTNFRLAYLGALTADEIAAEIQKTGIESLSDAEGAESSSRIFNIAGQAVNKSVDTLTPGFYVIGHRKTIVK